jgi:hypothetical protein
MTCISDAPVPLRHRAPEVPIAVEAVVMRALSKVPEERPSVSELARALREAVLEGGTPVDQPLGETIELPRPAR